MMSKSQFKTLPIVCIRHMQKTQHGLPLSGSFKKDASYYTQLCCSNIIFSCVIQKLASEMSCQARGQRSQQQSLSSTEGCNRSYRRFLPWETVLISFLASQGVSKTKYCIMYLQFAESEQQHSTRQACNQSSVFVFVSASVFVYCVSYFVFVFCICISACRQQQQQQQGSTRQACNPRSRGTPPPPYIILYSVYYTPPLLILYYMYYSIQCILYTSPLLIPPIYTPHLPR